jgi:hypothetical protein
VLRKIFYEIGFSQTENELFKDLILYRLVYPRSKLKTVQYLSCFGAKKYTDDALSLYGQALFLVSKCIGQENIANNLF